MTTTKKKKPTTGKPASSNPTVAFTLDKLEKQAAPEIEPLRMAAGGKVIEFASPGTLPMSMLPVLVGADEDPAAAVELLPALIGEENYQHLQDCGMSIGATMLLMQKVGDYYRGAIEGAAGDPKD